MPKKILKPKGKFYEFRFKIGDVETPVVKVHSWSDITDTQYDSVQGILLKRLRQTPHEAIGPFELEDGDFDEALKAFASTVNPQSALQIHLEHRRQRRAKEIRDAG